MKRHEVYTFVGERTGTLQADLEATKLRLDEVEKKLDKLLAIIHESPDVARAVEALLPIPF